MLEVSTTNCHSCNHLCTRNALYSIIAITESWLSVSTCNSETATSLGLRKDGSNIIIQSAVEEVGNIAGICSKEEGVMIAVQTSSTAELIVVELLCSTRLPPSPASSFFLRLVSLNLMQLVLTYLVTFLTLLSLIFQKG